MLLGLLVLCIVIMRCFPETALARLLHQALVDAPLDWLAKTKRQDIIFVFVTVLLFLSAGEFLAIYGSAELLALSLNLSIYLDALAVTYAIAAAGLAIKAVKVLRTHLSLWRVGAVKRVRAAARALRTRRTRPRKSLDTEDEPSGAFALAL